MGKTTRESKTIRYTTELGGVEIEVEFDRITDWEPDYQIEFHGIHTMNDSEEKIILTKVELLIPHTGYVDILANMNYYQKLQLITELENA